MNINHAMGPSVLTKPWLTYSEVQHALQNTNTMALPTTPCSPAAAVEFVMNQPVASVVYCAIAEPSASGKRVKGSYIKVLKAPGSPLESEAVIISHDEGKLYDISRALKRIENLKVRVKGYELTISSKLSDSTEAALHLLSVLSSGNRKEASVYLAFRIHNYMRDLERYEPVQVGRGHSSNLNRTAQLLRQTHEKAQASEALASLKSAIERVQPSDNDISAVLDRWKEILEAYTPRHITMYMSEEVAIAVIRRALKSVRNEHDAFKTILAVYQSGNTALGDVMQSLCKDKAQLERLHAYFKNASGKT